MNQSKRTNLLPNPKLQGALLIRLLSYWLAGVMVMLSLAIVQAMVAGSDASFSVLLNRALLAFGPALLSSVALLPLLMFDALRFSIRFAGPLRRLTQEAHRMANGLDVAPVNFREDDYWHELAVPFNAVAAELKRLRAAERHTEAATDTENTDSHVTA